MLFGSLPVGLDLNCDIKEVIILVETDKEKLERIKKETETLWKVSPNLKWLIEQAENVEKLRKENWELNKEIGAYSQMVLHIAEENSTVTKHLESLAKKMLEAK